MQQASFQVDSRAGMLPSQNYSTAGEALKELVDNAWDADAEEVGRTSKSGVRSKAGKGSEICWLMSAVGGASELSCPLPRIAKKITCRRTGDFRGFSNR
jgi:hypothetical protein